MRDAILILAFTALVVLALMALFPPSLGAAFGIGVWVGGGITVAVFASAYHTKR